MSLDQFLVWILGGGSIVAVSFIFERSKWFQEKLTSEGRKWVMYASCVAITFGAYSIQAFVPADILATIAPWFSIASGLFYTIFISKVFHTSDKETTDQG